MQLLGLDFTHVCSAIKTQRSSATIGFDESLSTNFDEILEKPVEGSNMALQHALCQNPKDFHKKRLLKTAESSA